MNPADGRKRREALSTEPPFSKADLLISYVKEKLD